MGIYYSSTLKCTGCKFKKTWDTMDNDFQKLMTERPVFQCGSCGSKDFMASDSVFYSFNMSFEDSGVVPYKPLTESYTVLLQEEDEPEYDYEIVEDEDGEWVEPHLTVIDLHAEENDE